MCANSRFPDNFRDYLCHLAEENPNHPYALEMADPERNFDLMSDLKVKFESVSSILNKREDELMSTFDLGCNDLGPGRLESFVAELRVCSYLKELGFQSVKHVRTQRKERIPTTDFVGRLDEVNYAVEVFCIIQDDFAEPLPFPSSGSPDYSLDRETFVQKLFDKYTAKKNQLDATMKSGNCSKGIIIAVIDAESMKNLNTHSTFLQTLERIFERLSWNQCFHIGIFTGSATLDEGRQDCIFPSIT